MSTEISKELVDEFVGVAHGDFNRVKSLLEKNPELINMRASWGELPVEAAAQTGQVAIAEYLLERGARMDICTAAMLGKKDTVAAMLAVDKSLSQATGAHGIPAIYFATISGNLEIAEMLLCQGAPVNGGEGVSTPLHAAVWFNHPQMVKWLLEHGANPQGLDFNKQTPYEAAIDKGRGESIKLLEAAGTGG
jgi:ankyrin repeat protein